jgi:1-deoxy-D-xylulose-5-phosphate reductoisomerase
LRNKFAPSKPSLAAVADEKAAAALKIAVADYAVKVLAGLPGVCVCAATACDTVLNGMVGMAGLEPTLAAIAAGKRSGARKQRNACRCRRVGDARGRIERCAYLAVDSEHSAIFQSLQGCSDMKMVRRIILTASGGPFFGKTRAELQTVTLLQALKHPNWSMGAKITVDSATMMNKGLELIEAVGAVRATGTAD